MIAVLKPYAVMLLLLGAQMLVEIELMCRGMMQDMEKNVKEFAAGVEQLVDRIVSGELGVDLAQNADKYVSGFIRQFEDGYSKLEQAVRTRFLTRSRRAKAVKAPKVVKTAMKKKGKSLLRKSTSITEAILSRGE